MPGAPPAEAGRRPGAYTLVEPSHHGRKLWNGVSGQGLADEAFEAAFGQVGGHEGAGPFVGMAQRVVSGTSLW